MTGRILFINPNSNARCGAGIAAALGPFRAEGFPMLDVVTLPDGPPAIVAWSDWYAAAGPILTAIRREDHRTDLFAIACASDPALPAAREATRKPVIGIFAAAVAQALTRAERFGVIALASASIERHALALRQMGTEARLAAEIETGEARNRYRFSAAAAYYEIVQRRIEDLREGRIEGLQTIREFTERRLAPAMNTVRDVARRQEML
ncbi:MAG: DUF3422 family protein, partial [Elioraea tepidiphila]